MTDALIGRLAKISALRVISRSSSMRYKGTRVPLHQIGSELNVDAVVDGAVLRSGERVRVSAELSHAPTDRNLRTESYERDLRDVLALQRELAEAITQQVRVELTREERARWPPRPAVDPDVYQGHPEGPPICWTGPTSRSLRQAVERLKQALALNPRYALVDAGLALPAAELGPAKVGELPEQMRPWPVGARRRRSSSTTSWPTRNARWPSGALVVGMARC